MPDEQPFAVLEKWVEAIHRSIEEQKREFKELASQITSMREQLARVETHQETFTKASERLETIDNKVVALEGNIDVVEKTVNGHIEWHGEQERDRRRGRWQMRVAVAGGLIGGIGAIIAVLIQVL